ncbi:MAG: YceI family protein [Deltaproteobacteria bacterium]|nr:YceI family protein [Deltaproteobacteria bacterium]
MGAVLATSILAGGSAQAGSSYVIDASHSEAAFQIRHLVTKVRGNFTSFEGKILLDSGNLEASSVNFEIDASSVNTSNKDRDDHLRGEDFFAVEKFPKITFESASFKKSGDDRYDVEGTLTMRGVAKKVTLPVSFLGEAKDPWGNTRAGFETEITLNRKDYGINWNAALDQGGYILGDDVKVEINLEVIKEKPEMKQGE